VVEIQLSRGTTAATNLFGAHEQLSVPSITVNSPSALLGFDIPNTTGNVTYAVQGKVSAATMTYNANSSGVIAAREIQI
jgi:hypothetical protein